LLYQGFLPVRAGLIRLLALDRLFLLELANH
jgi:hypothetical protein